MHKYMFLLVFVGLQARAEEATVAVVHHVALDSTPVDRALPVEVTVEGAGLLTSLELRVQPAEGPPQRIPFERVDERTYRAVIPPSMVGGPHLAYAIVSTDRAGAVQAHFASPEVPHHVDVHGRGVAATAQAQLARYQGHRNALRLQTEAVGFGGRPLDDGTDRATDDYSDAWVVVAGEYIHRPLTLIHDFRFRAGFMRANRPEVDGEPVVGGKSPGLNFGAAEVNLEVHRWFSLGGRLVLGANEEGFVAGVGAVARVGDIAANHLAIDVETIGDVGSRTDIRFHWTTVPRFPMALGVTFTDWPNAQPDGTSTLLSYDVAVDLTSRSQVGLRLGAANRPESVATGVMGGLNYRQSF